MSCVHALWMCDVYQFLLDVLLQYFNPFKWTADYLYPLYCYSPFVIVVAGLLFLVVFGLFFQPLIPIAHIILYLDYSLFAFDYAKFIRWRSRHIKCHACSWRLTLQLKFGFVHCSVNSLRQHHIHSPCTSTYAGVGDIFVEPKFSFYFSFFVFFFHLTSRKPRLAVLCSKLLL